MQTPYYHEVPKDPVENADYRDRILDIGAKSSADARGLWSMCRDDLLFYVNTFCYLFEPRTAETLPFITYDYQDDAFLTMADCVGVRDLVIEKSRDMGASWMCVTTFEWYWHFHGMQMFLLLSRKEDLVDKRGDCKSLFWKIDFLHKHQPRWLLPEMLRLKMHKENVDTGASMDGESTNEFAGVADRRRALLLDEFSKMENDRMIFAGTRDVTDSRFFNFTPQGAANTAYDIAHKEDFRKITLHWSQHPLKAKGLYRVDDDGEIKLLDKEYWTPERVADYDFVHKQPDNPRFFYRSPWYDHECRRAVHVKEIAQELDIDYLGSDYGFFDAVTLKRVMDEYVQEPLYVGDLDYEMISVKPREFVTLPGGPLQLWTPLVGDDHPPRDQGYVLGADICAGTGASNTVFHVAGRRTRAQVAEWCWSNLRPDQAAKVAVALARWFRDPEGNGAYMIWEANGPGREFGNTVVNDLHYSNIYYRRETRSIRQKMSDFPGWWSTPETKLALFGDYRSAIASGDFPVRSRNQIKECRQIIFTPQGIVHARALHSVDPSGARQSHGDRPTAGALCRHALGKAILEAPVEPEVPRSSILQRRLDAQRKERDKRQW